MNSKNNKTSEPDKILLNSEDKTDLRRSDKCFSLLDLNMYCTCKHIKKLYKS